VEDPLTYVLLLNGDVEKRSKTMNSLTYEIEKVLDLSQRLKTAVQLELEYGCSLQKLLNLPRTANNKVLINRLISQSTR
jgi:hypothetical protein